MFEIIGCMLIIIVTQLFLNWTDRRRAEADQQVAENKEEGE